MFGTLRTAHRAAVGGRPVVPETGAGAEEFGPFVVLPRLEVEPEFLIVFRVEFVDAEADPQLRERHVVLAEHLLDVPARIGGGVEEEAVEVGVELDLVFATGQFGFVAGDVHADVLDHRHQRFRRDVGGEVDKFRLARTVENAGFVESFDDRIDPHAVFMVVEAVLLRRDEEQRDAVFELEAFDRRVAAEDPLGLHHLPQEGAQRIGFGVLEDVGFGHHLGVVVVPDEVDGVGVLIQIEPELRLHLGVHVAGGVVVVAVARRPRRGELRVDRVQRAGDPAAGVERRRFGVAGRGEERNGGEGGQKKTHLFRIHNAVKTSDLCCLMPCG